MMSTETRENIITIHVPKLATPVMIIAAAIMLSSLALFNGFPLILGDTGAYISHALSFLKSFTISWVRPVFYSIFILPLHLKISLWPIVLAQGLIIAHLIFITLRVTNPQQAVSFGSFFIVILILTVCTSLPWLVGQIMADLFTSVVILGLFLLGFGFDRLTRLEIVYIFFLTAAAISFHYSHLPLAVGLVIVTLALQGLLKWYDWFRVKRLAILIGPLTLASSALLAVNIVGTGQGTLFPGGPVLLLARLIEDGTARMYLDQTCPEKAYALCPYRNELSSGWNFLWSDNAVLKRLGGGWKLRAEAGDIVWGSLRAYPVQQIHKSLQNFGEQFIRFSTGDNVVRRVEGSYSNKVIQNVFGPSVHARYIVSRQNTGKLPIVTVRWFHNIAILVSIPIVVCLFVIFMRRNDSLYVSLFILIVAGLIGNAFITGVLSTEVSDRYQSRVIWLLVFYAIVGVLQLIRGSLVSRGPILQDAKVVGP